jgi:hypothetical protein
MRCFILIMHKITAREIDKVHLGFKEKSLIVLT